RRLFRYRYRPAPALRVQPEIRALSRRRLRRKIRANGEFRPARGREHRRGALRRRPAALVLSGMIMRTILATLAITFAIILIGAVFVYSGVYDIGATAPHWRITHWVLETVRVRSIEAHAAGITAPPGLDDPAKVLMGTE